MKKIEFKPVTGLDVAKLLGPKAVKDYLESKRLQEEKFKVGTFYEYTEIMPSLDNMLDDIVEAFTGSREDVLRINGPIIYNDGTTDHPIKGGGR